MDSNYSLNDVGFFKSISRRVLKQCLTEWRSPAAAEAHGIPVYGQSSKTVTPTATEAEAAQRAPGCSATATHDATATQPAVQPEIFSSMLLWLQLMN